MADPTTKPKSKSVPRTERGKRIDPPSNEQQSLIREIASMARSAQKKCKLSSKQTGILINREPKTMEADRRKQRALLAAKKKAQETGEKAADHILGRKLPKSNLQPALNTNWRTSQR